MRQLNSRLVATCAVLGVLQWHGASSLLSAQPLNPNLLYTSVEPCRIFDTRPNQGGSGPLIAGTPRAFDVVGSGSAFAGQGGHAGGCGLPAFDSSSRSQVQAVMFNFVSVNAAGAGDLRAWPSDRSAPQASILNYQPGITMANGVVLPVRQDAQGGDITLLADVSGTQVLADVVGYFSSNSTAEGSGTGNLFLGSGAGKGFGAAGSENTGLGQSALTFNSLGSANTAVGYEALTFAGISGGGNNTAVGEFALHNIDNGTNNIGIGQGAGSNYDGSESDNIVLYDIGTTGESAVIRIGTQGTQTKAFVAGISGTTSSGGVEVFVNASGQLGTSVSSVRFKQDVHDMGDRSAGLLQLRPVTFRYKSGYDDGSRLLQYGLVAEDVAKVYPELVQYDQEGRPLAVRYHFVNAMLLNEVQKQHATIAAQASQIEGQAAKIGSQQLEITEQRRRLEETIAAQAAQLQDFAARLARLESRLVDAP